MFTAINRAIFLRFMNENGLTTELPTPGSSRMDAAHTLASLATITPAHANSLDNPINHSPSPTIPTDCTSSRCILPSSVPLPGQCDAPPVRSLRPSSTYSKKPRKASNLPEQKLKGVKRKAGTESGNSSTSKRARASNGAESEEGDDVEFEIERITGHVRF